MWLPKDERKLLKHYYKKYRDAIDSGEVSPGSPNAKSITCQVEELNKVIGLKKNDNNYNKYIIRVNIANTNLRNNGFIEYNPDYMIDEAISDGKDFELTTKGLHLGKKYSSCFGYAGLWCKEYKHLLCVLRALL